MQSPNREIDFKAQRTSYRFHAGPAGFSLEEYIFWTKLLIILAVLNQRASGDNK